MPQQTVTVHERACDGIASMMRFELPLSAVIGPAKRLTLAVTRAESNSSRKS